MIMLRIEPGLFSALRAGFEAAACADDAPISTKLLSRLRPALAAAAATAPPRRPILVMLESVAELYALGDCFAVGGEGHPRVTDAQWETINALIDQTAGAAASWTQPRGRRLRPCRREPQCPLRNRTPDASATGRPTIGAVHRREAA